MASDLSQVKIIDNLNAYLKWHNLPLKLDKGGVCNGLASVYTKYHLEGRDNEFFEMLQYVGGKKPTSEQEMEVNHFVAQVILSFIPQEFNKQLNQGNSIQSLMINNKSLTSSFDLAMTTSDKNWENIIRDIDLRENEVMRVGSINHAIAVSRQKNNYVVYDPNYSSGFKIFSTEAQLIKELHKNVFAYDKKGPLGMEINIVRHPEQETRTFPSIKELYDRYLMPQNVNAKAVTDGKGFVSLNAVAKIGNGEQIQQLIEKGAMGIDIAAVVAVVNNNCDTLRVLLNHTHHPSEIRSLFYLALIKGRYEAFNELLKNERCEQLYSEIILPLNYGRFLHNAAKGGNVTLLEQFLQGAQAQINEEEEKKYWDNAIEEIQIEELDLGNLLGDINEIQVETLNLGDLLEEDDVTVDEEDSFGIELVNYGAMQIEEYKEPQFSNTNVQSAVQERLTKMILEKIDGTDSIQEAIKSGSLSSVKRLLDTVSQSQSGLTEKQSLDYLIYAIKHNQPYVVDAMVNYVSKEALQSISMSTAAVEKTDLHILNTLRNSGVEFSEAAHAVIEKKAHRSVGLILSIGIKLAQFTDFCKEVLFKKEGVSCNIQKFNEFKARNAALKPSNVDGDLEVEKTSSMSSIRPS